MELQLARSSARGMMYAQLERLPPSLASRPLAQQPRHRQARTKSATKGNVEGGRRVKLGADLRPQECVLCIDGRGVVKCHNCDGEGCYYTEPGLAGKSNTVGLARCKLCNGTGNAGRLVRVFNFRSDRTRRDAL